MVELYKPHADAQKRRILFLTGTRADFGKLKPLIQEVARAPDFQYEIFATGMHMLSLYGATIVEIRQAGFDRIYPFINQDSAVSSQMDLVLATTIQGVGHYVRESRPDLLVVHGDRVEALAGAIAGSLNNVRVAHVEGGELSGTIDELLRHAVSKLSHVHFVATQEARQRLIQMGELDESVFTIGSPDVDVMLSDALPDREEVARRYEIPFDDYGILIFHPVTTEMNHTAQHVDAVVSAVTASNRNYVVIYPNNDAGSEIILGAYKKLRSSPRIRLLPSMRFEYFLTLLRHAFAIVGNSSAGIREAPVYGVPTVNIGSRQQNRFVCPSILDVPAERDAILHALANLPPSLQPNLHFGKGESAQLFLEVLRAGRIWETPTQKQFRDLPATSQAPT